MKEHDLATISYLRIFGCLAIAIATGCSSTSREIKRGPTYVTPGGPVFASYVEQRVTTTSDFSITKGDRDPARVQAFTSIDRTWWFQIDPVTDRATPLASVRGGASPFYWDPRREILWLADPESYDVVGVSAKSVHYPGGSKRTRFVHAPALPAPFAYRARTTRLWSAATHTEIEVGSTGKPHVDGSLLRLVDSATADGVVHAVVIDRANASGPVRLPDITWQAPPLPGDRLAHGVTANGRRFVEVVALADGFYVVAHDLTSGVPTRSRLALTELFWLDVLSGDLVAILMKSGKDGCSRGFLFDAATGMQFQFDSDPCVHRFERHPGLSDPLIWLPAGIGYFDRVRGEIVTLGKLHQVSVIDPTTVAFAREEANGYAIERLDLATGTITALARRSRAPTLLHVDDEKIVIGEGDELHVRRIRDSSWRRLTIPSGPGKAGR